MTISVTTLLIVVLCVACSWLGVKWYFQKDTEQEERRRGAAKFAAKLSNLGLKRIPEFLVDYSVGDYSGMLNKIAQVAKTFLEGEDAVMAEFNEVFANLLVTKLKTEEGRMYIEAKLLEAKKLYAPEEVEE